MFIIQARNSFLEQQALHEYAHFKLHGKFL
jgi:hypothetical protein